jgi:SAM-dependent methyltransferase
MVAFGARRVAADNVTWAQADALSLPFADGAFDAVVCQFGAMFFPDRVQGFREALRVLAPGGRYILSMWAPVEFSPVSQTVERAVAAAFPGDPPGFISRTPHGHGDPAVTEAELREAGFGAIRVEDVACTGRVRSALDPAIGFCQGSPLRGEIVARDANRLEEVTRAAADAVTTRFGDAPFGAPMRAFVFTATKASA